MENDRDYLEINNKNLILKLFRKHFENEEMGSGDEEE